MTYQRNDTPEPLCEDEGCDHYGTSHVCRTPPVEEDDWLVGSQACDLSGEGACESCQ